MINNYNLINRIALIFSIVLKYLKNMVDETNILFPFFNASFISKWIFSEYSYSML